MNKEFLRMFRYTRSAYSEGYEAFIVEQIEPKGFTVDLYGNYWFINNPYDSKVLPAFTAHIDTVHSNKSKTKQKLSVENNMLFTANTNCLGADDTTGIYILFKLLESGVPGLYLLFADEESGGYGSNAMEAEWQLYLDMWNLDRVDKMVSFDRRGYSDVITHQFGQRCCSDKFARGLANQLNHTNESLSYKPNNGGIFTDSANFMETIPECTNLSVGYFNEHSPTERQDLLFIEELVKGLLEVDWDALPVERDPTVIDYGFGDYNNRGVKWGYWEADKDLPPANARGNGLKLIDGMLDLVELYDIHEEMWEAIKDDVDRVFKANGVYDIERRLG